MKELIEKTDAHLKALWSYLAAIQMYDIETNDGVERFRTARTHFNAVLSGHEALAARHERIVTALNRYSSSLPYQFMEACLYAEDTPKLCRTHNYEDCPVPALRAALEGND